MEAQHQRSADIRPMRVVPPEDKARWYRAHKFNRYGITPDRFNQMLEGQGERLRHLRHAVQGRPADLFRPRPRVLPRSG